MPILAIDPGPLLSGLCILDGARVLHAGVEPTPAIRLRLKSLRTHLVAIEMIACYGMAVGAEVFTTCVEIGRMVEIQPLRCSSRAYG